MDIITVGTSGIHKVNEQQPIDIYCNPLLTTLQEAAFRATQRRRSILASFTFPIAAYDSIRAFQGARQAQLGECFFWEHPVEQQALIGVGTALTIETSGRTCFTDAATAWRNVMQEAVVSHVDAQVLPRAVPTTAVSPSMSQSLTPTRGITTSQGGPVFFGGFAFDPLTPRTSLWTGFPDGLLILPNLLLSYNAGHVTLTLNRMMSAEDGVEHYGEEMIAGVKRLLDAIVGAQFIAPSNDIDTHQSPIYRAPTAARPTNVGAQFIAPSDGRASQQGAINQAPTDRLVGAQFIAPSDDSASHQGAINRTPTSEWMTLVAQTVQRIRQGAYEKVVLARSVQVALPAHTDTFDIPATLQQLRQSYPDTYVFAIQRGERFFVGATPERLIQAEDGQIRTMALAGSARRGASEEEDMQIGGELLQSQKNNAEHALVVTKVRDALLTHCTHVHVVEKPHLLKLKNVQHLKTPIVGELLAGRCILDVMANLHPTPAVGGFPHEAALMAIRSAEKLDRGWYAGPLGWIGPSGHGEFAVALRSGLIGGNRATLFAGCGIVADSDPESEYIESCLKLQVMLRGLQVS